MGAVVQAVGEIMGGNAQQSAYDERALELRQQAKAVETQAKEQIAVRDTELQKTLGAITALTASRGLNTLSPSAQAIAGGQKKIAYLDTSATEANALTQSGMLRESARAAGLAGDNAVTQGWFSALGTIDDAATKAILGGA